MCSVSYCRLGCLPSVQGLSGPSFCKCSPRSSEEVLGAADKEEACSSSSSSSPIALLPLLSWQQHLLQPLQLIKEKSFSQPPRTQGVELMVQSSDKGQSQVRRRKSGEQAGARGEVVARRATLRGGKFSFS